MHDPMVVAFEIRRPWPERAGFFPREKTEKRWEISRSAFWILAGQRYYFPPLITVWHEEPGGADSGSVCKHYKRWQREDGGWDSKRLHAWKWHVHHWSVQVQPLLALQRKLLRRCSICDGRGTKASPVNLSCENQTWFFQFQKTLPKRRFFWQRMWGTVHHRCPGASEAEWDLFCGLIAAEPRSDRRYLYQAVPALLAGLTDAEIEILVTLVGDGTPLDIASDLARLA